MKTRLAILSLLAFGASAPTLAIPVQFDISGTVQYAGYNNLATGEAGSFGLDGGAFSMRFTFDTGYFDAGTLRTHEAGRSLRFDAFDADAWGGSFTVGAVTRSMTLVENFMALEYSDSNGIVQTPSGEARGLDGVGLVLGGLPADLGQSEFSMLQLSSIAPFDDSNPTAAGQTYIDLDGGYAPLDILSISLPYASLFYLYQTPTYGESWSFNIDSITRSSNSVPEPGTLSLLAMGLLGAAIASRRRRV